MHFPMSFLFYISCTVAYHVGLCTGILQGSLVGFSGEVNTLMVSAVLAGEALAGTIVSILKMITKASMPYTEQGLTIYILFSSPVLHFAPVFVSRLIFFSYRSNESEKQLTLSHVPCLCLLLMYSLVSSCY